jgi:hypothetical protein
MEGHLLGRLNWDLAVPTSLDFLHLLLPSYEYELLPAVKEDVTRLLTRAALEYQFCAVRPSVLAAAALLTAVQMVSWEGRELVSMQSERWKRLHVSLADLLSIEKVAEEPFLYLLYSTVFVNVDFSAL